MIHKVNRGNYEIYQSDLKPGTRVRIKPVDWFNDNAVTDGGERYVMTENGLAFIQEMIGCCGKIVNISTIDTMVDGKIMFRTRDVLDDKRTYWFNTDMVECIVD